MKRSKKKLVLSRETLHNLTNFRLSVVLGGFPSQYETCTNGGTTCETSVHTGYTCTCSNCDGPLTG